MDSWLEIVSKLEDALQEAQDTTAKPKSMRFSPARCFYYFVRDSATGGLYSFAAPVCFHCGQ